MTTVWPAWTGACFETVVTGQRIVAVLFDQELGDGPRGDARARRSYEHGDPGCGKLLEGLDLLLTSALLGLVSRKSRTTKFLVEQGRPVRCDCVTTALYASLHLTVDYPPISARRESW